MVKEPSFNGLLAHCSTIRLLGLTIEEVLYFNQNVTRVRCLSWVGYG